MPSYDNDLVLTELATGEGSGTWGDTTNVNLELIGEAFSYGTGATFGSDADQTVTVNQASHLYRKMFILVTSTSSLSATRTLTINPTTISKMMLIRNGTSGNQSIIIKQGSGATVTIPNGMTKMVILDGAGSSAAVIDCLDYVSLSSNATIGGVTPISADSTTTFLNKTFDADGTGNSLTNIDDSNIKSGADINAAKIADGTISNAEFLHLNGVSSNIQSQLDSKGDITGVTAGSNLTGGGTSGTPTLALSSTPSVTTVTASSTITGDLRHNSSSGFLSSSSSAVNRAPDVLKRDYSTPPSGLGTAASGYFWHPLGTTVRYGYNGTSVTGNYITLGTGTWYIRGSASLGRYASDTADTTYMFLAHSGNANSHLVDGMGSAIGDWSTTTFIAEGQITLSGTYYIGIRFYAGEEVRYRYVSSQNSTQYFSNAYLSAWRMY
jgi:hypothetical protein